MVRYNRQQTSGQDQFKAAEAASNSRLSFSFTGFYLIYVLNGLSGRHRPDLEVFDADLVIAQNCGLKGA